MIQNYFFLQSQKQYPKGDERMKIFEEFFQLLIRMLYYIVCANLLIECMTIWAFTLLSQLSTTITTDIMDMRDFRITPYCKTDIGNE